MSSPGKDMMREFVRGAITTRLGRAESSTIDDDTNLTELVDSADLLDIIVAVEERARVQFNPEDLDLENGLTLAQLIAAFSGDYLGHLT